MKSNYKLDNQNFIAEVSISSMIEEDEASIHAAYMDHCTTNGNMDVDTETMSASDAKYMCGMSYMKNRAALTHPSGELTDEQQKLPDALKKEILKRHHKAGRISEAGIKQMKHLGCWGEMQAEPTAKFVQKTAPENGAFLKTAEEDGLKEDNKLKEQDKKDGPKHPDLQSPTFEK
jgi:hypothetical protein